MTYHFCIVRCHQCPKSCDLAMHACKKYVEVTHKLGISYVFKNFEEIKRAFGVPVIADIHEVF